MWENWFSPASTYTYTYTPVSSTNKTDRHDITEILLKVALTTIILWENNNVHVDKHIMTEDGLRSHTNEEVSE
jgi:hypothetical protein